MCVCVICVTYHSFILEDYTRIGKRMYVGRTTAGTGTEIILIEALSHLARSVLRKSPYTQIVYPVAKLPVRQKIYASLEYICNEHRISRIITGHKKNIKRTLTNNIRFLYVRSIRPSMTGPYADSSRYISMIDIRS